ncbi:C2H2-type domain-containing protein [Aphis craccivora]|uniref:C2H2-type domain-containing protein n=1 Tax=Aphis craccivora TaxID=307492 RepID=A0A6G0VVX6_APHCR|nr:C2H2-type domain-containing protein [Aphis craccivora]
MKCFICELNVPSLPSLVYHYKIIHLLGPFNSYTCVEDDCLKSFQSLSSLKKHILNKHVNSVEDNLSETTVSCSGILTDTIIYKSISSSNNSDNNDASNILFDQPKRAKLNEETFDTNNCIEELHLGAVKFCLKLHNNNNCCKSDVQNIQSDIENNILNPIIKLLMGVIQKEVQEPLILSKFSQVILGITDLFKFCKTEYLLNNWLKNNEFISDQYKQFTINNEVNLISNNGQTAYNEILTKDVLMPLKFQIKTYFEYSN